MRKLVSYTNYREYLADYIADAKQRGGAFSFRGFAKIAGINSPNYLQRVLSGARALGPAMVQKFADALQLEATDREYFRALVEFNQEQAPAAKAQAAEILAELRRRTLDVTRPKRVDDSLCDRWYTMVVWELASCHEFELTAENVSQAFRGRVSLNAAYEAIQELRGRGYLIATDRPHVYRQGEWSIKTSDEKRNFDVRQNHEFYSRLAAERIEEPLPTREYQGLTIALSPERLAIAKVKLKAFAEKLLAELGDDAAASQVYRINLQAFPVTFPLK